MPPERGSVPHLTAAPGERLHYCTVALARRAGHLSLIHLLKLSTNCRLMSESGENEDFCLWSGSRRGKRSHPKLQEKFKKQLDLLLIPCACQPDYLWYRQVGWRHGEVLGSTGKGVRRQPHLYAQYTQFQNPRLIQKPGALALLQHSWGSRPSTIVTRPRLVQSGEKLCLALDAS